MSESDLLVAEITYENMAGSKIGIFDARGTSADPSLVAVLATVQGDKLTMFPLTAGDIYHLTEAMVSLAEEAA